MCAAAGAAWVTGSLGGSGGGRPVGLFIQKHLIHTALRARGGGRVNKTRESPLRGTDTESVKKQINQNLPGGESSFEEN